MHELGLAERILDIALDAAAANGGGRVLRMRLKVGQLTCVDPDSLRFALDILARDTPAAGCDVEVERTPSRLRCSKCGGDSHRELLDPCPRCGAHGGDVLSGREFLLDSLEIDTPETTCSTSKFEAARSTS